MIARVKATGEIIEINEASTIYDARKCQVYNASELEDVSDIDSDYWTRLEHQAAIAAMGGICGNPSYDETTWEIMAEDAIWAAHILIQQLKEKEERK